MRENIFVLSFFSSEKEKEKNLGRFFSRGQTKHLFVFLFFPEIVRVFFNFYLLEKTVNKIKRCFLIVAKLEKNVKSQ